MTLEATKKRLNRALERLADVIREKITSLEFENKKLRAEVTKLQNQMNSPESSSKNDISSKNNLRPEQENTYKEDKSLIKPQVAGEIDLTLSKLKKLVG